MAASRSALSTQGENKMIALSFDPKQGTQGLSFNGLVSFNGSTTQVSAMGGSTEIFGSVKDATGAHAIIIAAMLKAGEQALRELHAEDFAAEAGQDRRRA